MVKYQSKACIEIVIKNRNIGSKVRIVERTVYKNGYSFYVKYNGRVIQVRPINDCGIDYQGIMQE